MQIRDAKLTKGNWIKILSWVKWLARWLGTGDKPRKIFFTILEAKQQRESMLILITNTWDIIANEEGILLEVTRFYSDLFKSTGNYRKTHAAK